MKKLVVARKRSFEVKAKSVLSATHCAGKIAVATGNAVADQFDTLAELNSVFDEAALLVLVNEHLAEKARESAKCESPWTDLEVMVEKISKNKGLTPQETLDMLVGYDLCTVPAFLDSAPADAPAAESTPAVETIPADVPAAPVAAEPRLRKGKKG